MSSRSTTRNLCWFHLPLLFSAIMLPTGKAYATPIQGKCNAATDKKPRIALISAFSGEADRFVDEMRLNDGVNEFIGCVIIFGHRFSKG